MTGNAIICKMGKHQEIPGADNIVKVGLFGEIIITQKTSKEGDLGILFDCETQLSPEFCRLNDLYDDSELNVTHGAKGYISSKNRRVRPITLKGVKVSGFWMPIKSIRYAFDSYAEYQQFCSKPEGTFFNKIKDTEICCKYITPETSKSLTTGARNRQKLKPKDRCPEFKRHYDTAHWGKVDVKFDYPYYATITEKLHGTSLRVGNLPVIHEKKWWQYLLFWKKYPAKYQIVVGSRNQTITYDLDNCHDNENIYVQAARQLLANGRPKEGVTLYCEIVGYDGIKPIMQKHSNEKLKNYLPKKEYEQFLEKFGKETIYSYDCVVGEFNVYVYRATYNNEEYAFAAEYIPNRLHSFVPILTKSTPIWICDDEDFKYLNNEIERLSNQSSYLDDSHISEGVCIRLEKEFDTEPKDGNAYGYWGSRVEVQVFKKKSFIFKVLEGIAKEDDKYVDQEEIN